MGDDPLDKGIVLIRCGFRAGQNIFGVEDVQPLILHRAHVEIIDRHDVKQIKVIFAAINLFIPDH